MLSFLYNELDSHVKIITQQDINFIDIISRPVISTILKKKGFYPLL